MQPDEPQQPTVLHSDSVAAEPPPLLGTWRAVYLVVLAELGVLVALFYALGWWAT